MTKNKTIILCDDEPAIIEKLCDLNIWKDLGINIIETANNGIFALKYIIEMQPDIAIIDIHMPGLDGLKLLADCKSQNIKTEFIILSGYSDFSYAKEALKFGAKAYLLKPINIPELYNELLRILHLIEGDSGKKSHDGGELLINIFKNILSGQIIDERLIQSLISSHTVTLKNTFNYVMVIQNEFEKINVSEVINELNDLLKDVPHFLFQYQNQLVGIFNETNKISFKIASTISDFIFNKTGIRVFIGVGDTFPSLNSISSSYAGAITAMTYKLYRPENDIFISDIICKTPPLKSPMDIEHLPLIQFIVKHDIEKISGFIDEFISEVLYVKMPPPNYVFSTCYALFHTIEGEFSQYTSDEIHIDANSKELFNCRSIDEIRSWLKTSFTKLSDYIDAVYGYSSSKQKHTNDFENEEDEIIQYSVHYIRNNLTKNVKISDIAGQVHLSPSYFAIYFKNKTGINLRDFILDEKMEYARKELLYSSTPVTDIAYSLGYGDYRSFSRAFKNIHKKTPTEFRTEYFKQ
jgi:response regulator containing cheY-like receiver domain and araC-type DNA-binding domain